MCHDYSFWNSMSSRCTHNTNDLEQRTYQSLCNRETVECSKTYSYDVKNRGINYCRNTSIGQDCLSVDKKFFCNISKTCINQGKITSKECLNLFQHFNLTIDWFHHMYVSDKKCDGIVHCIEGKDETYETCKDIFPDSVAFSIYKNSNAKWIKDHIQWTSWCMEYFSSNSLNCA